MTCPHCEADDSICKDSRQKDFTRYRTYLCRSCGKRYYTKEQPITSSVKVDAAQVELENTLTVLSVAMRGVNSALKFLGIKEGMQK